MLYDDSDDDQLISTRIKKHKLYFTRTINKEDLNFLTQTINLLEVRPLLVSCAIELIKRSFGRTRGSVKPVVTKVEGQVGN